MPERASRARGAVTALAIMGLAGLASACATMMMGGTVTDTIDAADPYERTILVGGKTIYVSDDFRFPSIMVGSRYRVLYDRVDGRYYATGIEEIGTVDHKN